MTINMACSLLQLLKIKRFFYNGDRFSSIDQNGASRVSKFTEKTEQRYYFMLLCIWLMVWNLWGIQACCITFLGDVYYFTVCDTKNKTKYVYTDKEGCDRVTNTCRVDSYLFCPVSNSMVDHIDINSINVLISCTRYFDDEFAIYLTLHDMMMSKKVQFRYKK